MSHQCPFPVHSTDNRRSYRAGSGLGCALGLALIVALLGYAGFSHAMPGSEIPSHADAGRTQACSLTERTT